MEQHKRIFSSGQCNEDVIEQLKEELRKLAHDKI